MKGIMCANGAPHCNFLPRKEENSTTITLERLLYTMVIDSHEGRKVATFDVPGAYLHTYLPKDKFTLLLLEGNFVDIMCDINPEYKQHISTKDSRKTLYLRTLKDICGMIESELLWYELYTSVIKDMSFQINPYDL